MFPARSQVLHLVNEPFLKRLQGLDCPEKLGWAFLDHVDLFKMYAVYCGNQPRLLTLLDEAFAASADLKRLDEKALNDSATRNQGLRDFLILPMQRICRYPLLLDSLLKATEGPQVDVDVLQEAIFRYKALVSQINEWTRRMESVEKLTEIEKRFKEGKALSLVQPKRHFIWEGRLKMRLPRSLAISPLTTAGKEVDLQDGARCFLFDDLLLSSAPLDSDDPKSLLLVKYSINLAQCFNVHVSDNLEETNKAGELVAFEVHFQFHSDADPSKAVQKKFKFKAWSRAERDEWVKKFRELPLLIARRDVANLAQKNQHLSPSRNDIAKRTPSGRLSTQSGSNATTDASSAQSQGTPKTRIPLSNSGHSSTGGSGPMLKSAPTSPRLISSANATSSPRATPQGTQSLKIAKHTINASGSSPSVSGLGKPYKRYRTESEQDIPSSSSSSHNDDDLPDDSNSSQGSNNTGFSAATGPVSPRPPIMPSKPPLTTRKSADADFSRSVIKARNSTENPALEASGAAASTSSAATPSSSPKPHRARVPSKPPSYSPPSIPQLIPKQPPTTPGGASVPSSAAAPADTSQSSSLSDGSTSHTPVSVISPSAGAGVGSLTRKTSKGANLAAGSLLLVTRPASAGHLSPRNTPIQELHESQHLDDTPSAGSAPEHLLEHSHRLFSQFSDSFDTLALGLVQALKLLASPGTPSSPFALCSPTVHSIVPHPSKYCK